MRARITPSRHHWRSLTFFFVIVPLAMAADDAPAQGPRSFDEQVAPILQKCIGCHGPDQPAPIWI